MFVQMRSVFLQETAGGSDLYLFACVMAGKLLEAISKSSTIVIGGQN